MTQEAFVKAYRSISRFRVDAPFRPWLLRIIRNEALNQRRRRGRQERLSLRLANDPVSGGAAPSPETTVITGVEKRTVLDAVERVTRSIPGRGHPSLLCSVSPRPRPRRRCESRWAPSSHGRRAHSTVSRVRCRVSGREAEMNRPIEQALLDLAHQINWPEPPDQALDLRRRLEASPRRRAGLRWVPVTAIILVLVASSAALLADGPGSSGRPARCRRDRDPLRSRSCRSRWRRAQPGRSGDARGRGGGGGLRVVGPWRSRPARRGVPLRPAIVGAGLDGVGRHRGAPRLRRVRNRGCLQPIRVGAGRGGGLRQERHAG